MRLIAIGAVVIAAFCSMGASGCNGEKDYMDNTKLPEEVKIRIGATVQHKLDPTLTGIVVKIMKKKPQSNASEEGSEYYVYTVNWLRTSKVLDASKPTVILNESKSFESKDMRDFEFVSIDK